MAGRPASNHFVCDAVSRSGRAICERSGRGSATAILSATPVTAKRLSWLSKFMRQHQRSPPSSWSIPPRCLDLIFDRRSRNPRHDSRFCSPSVGRALNQGSSVSIRAAPSQLCRRPRNLSPGHREPSPRSSANCDGRIPQHLDGLTLELEHCRRFCCRRWQSENGTCTRLSRYLFGLADRRGAFGVPLLASRWNTLILKFGF